MEPITITFAIISALGLIALFLLWRYDRKMEKKEQHPESK